MNSFKASTEAGLQKNDLENLLSISKRASKVSGQILMEHYGRLSMIKNKGLIGDLVTSADLASEECVISELQKHTPDIGILAEESGQKGNTSDLKWCVDPLDGTTNFAHGYPFFACSIGLTWKGTPILGTIEIPFLKESYWAAPEIGSFCNDQKIKVSSRKKLIESLLVTGFAYDRQTRIDNNYAEFCWLTHRTRGVRRGGAAAVDLAFIASGRLDAYWERGLAQWDLAAGVAIVEIAGGIISDYQGNNFNISTGKVVASCPGIQEELLKELNKVKPLKGKLYGAPEIDKMGF